MTTDSIVARVSNVLSQKNSISICFPSNPTYDTVAAGTALYMALLTMGKNVGLAASDAVDPSLGLIAQDKIQGNLIADGDNLVVSFPYKDGSVDKVTYNIENERFNLLIQPREGFSRLNPKQVKFSYTGGKPDVIIALYAPTLNALGKLYTAQADKFTGVDIINIDRHFTNSNYGTINYVDKKSASMSEMIFALIQSLKAKLDKDIVSNLYAGIAAATNNFTAHSVTGDTFEAAAFLLKNGAVKKPPMMGGAGMGGGMGTGMGMPGAGMGLGSGMGGNMGMGAPARAPMGQFGQQPPFGQQFGGYSQQFGNPPAGYQPQGGLQQGGLSQAQQPFGAGLGMGTGGAQPGAQPYQPYQGQGQSVGAPSNANFQQQIQRPMQQSLQQPFDEDDFDDMDDVGIDSIDEIAGDHTVLNENIMQGSQAGESQDGESQAASEDAEQVEQSQQQEEVKKIEPVAVSGPESDPHFIENKELKTDNNSAKSAPKDWLKPKIFKGTNLA